MPLSSSNRIAFVGSYDAIHGDEIDVLENHHRRLQRRGEVDRCADGSEALPRQQHDRAARASPPRGTSRSASCPCPAGRRAAGRDAGAARSPAAARHARRCRTPGARSARARPAEHDPLARDARQRAHGQRRALVVVEVPRAQLEHPAAVHVALAHQLRRARRARARPCARSGAMTSSPRLSPMPRSSLLSISDERAVVVAHEPEAGLHAGDALVLAERHGHVLDGAQLELESPTALPRTSSASPAR